MKEEMKEIRIGNKTNQRILIIVVEAVVLPHNHLPPPERELGRRGPQR